MTMCIWPRIFKEANIINDNPTLEEVHEAVIAEITKINKNLLAQKDSRKLSAEAQSDIITVYAESEKTEDPPRKLGTLSISPEGLIKLTIKGGVWITSRVDELINSTNDFRLETRLLAELRNPAREISSVIIDKYEGNAPRGDNRGALAYAPRCTDSCPGNPKPDKLEKRYPEPD